MIISETLGNYPFEENIIGTLNDARERFLKPGGSIIPAAVEQFARPVLGERLYSELAAWDEVGYGLDFSRLPSWSFNNIYVRWLTPADLLDGGAAAKPGTTCASTGRTRRRALARLNGRSHAQPPSTVWRCGGRPTWSRACACQPGRSRRARTGSSSIFRCWSRSRWRQGDAARTPEIHHVVRGRAPTLMWALSVADDTRRASDVAPGSRPGEGLPALRPLAQSAIPVLMGSPPGPCVSWSGLTRPSIRQLARAVCGWLDPRTSPRMTGLLCASVQPQMEIRRRHLTRGRASPRSPR